MRSTTTTKKIRVWSVLGATIAIVLYLTSCYLLKTVYQPTEGYTNSSFEAIVVASGIEGNPVPDGESDRNKIGNAGIMLPVGWTVKEPVVMIKTSLSGSYDDTDSIYYNTDLADILAADTTITAPEGYYWWGGVTENVIDWYDLDTAYFIATIYTDDQIGDFYLRYTVGDGGTAVDGDGPSAYMPITISDGTAVKNNMAESYISCYPNPTMGDLNVKVSAQLSNASLHVVNMCGQTVLQRENLSGLNTIDLSSFANGTYFIVLEENGVAYSQKVVLQK